ncbi:phage tailspike protein [Pseudescherichia sp.]|uniref:phage tailspike protein n=1 Tax=Pseudescherichia sp. TaxID=2055881 RepID=UPI0028999A73|nr:phage tailspike protein [Pseudescherichia sp.]
MADINANVVVSNPRALFTASRSLKALVNGRIYIGEIDTDPTLPSNQIPVYIENEDGSLVQIPQPLIINSGGHIVYLGQVVKVVTEKGHSMAVYDAFLHLQDYIPNVLKYEPDQFRAEIEGVDGYKHIPSLWRVLSEMPVEYFRSSGMSDQQVIEAANNYGNANGVAILFETDRLYEVETLTVKCDWRGKSTIKRKAGTSLTLLSFTNGRTVSGLTIDGNNSQCSGYASNILMNAVSGAVFENGSSINALGHSIEINNSSTTDDNRQPNRLSHLMIAGTTVGHGISLYDAASEIIDDINVSGCAGGVVGGGSQRGIRPVRMSRIDAHHNRDAGIATGFISTVDTPVYEMVSIIDAYSHHNGKNGFAVQSHHTTLTSCHAYRNGTLTEHQGFLINADSVTLSSLIAFENAGVGYDFGDCRKCTGTSLIAESNGWIGLEINSCEDMAFSGIVMNDNFKGQPDGEMQAAITIHKGNGGYPFQGDNKNIAISGAAIRGGDGQRYAVYVDSNSFNVALSSISAKSAALLDDIYTASSNVSVSNCVTRWDPLGQARAIISSGALSIPSIADSVSVNGTGSVINVNILNGGAFVKDRTVRLIAVNGFTLENSGPSGTGNLFLGSSRVIVAGDFIKLWSDGSGGWKLG